MIPPNQRGTHTMNPTLGEYNKPHTLKHCLYLLDHLVDFLTGSQNAVCEMDVGDEVVVFTITIPESEAGRIIGRYGDTIKSLRSVMYSITMKQHRIRSNVLVEPI